MGELLVIDALWTSLIIRQQSESNVGKYRLSVLDPEVPRYVSLQLCTK